MISTENHHDKRIIIPKPECICAVWQAYLFRVFASNVKFMNTIGPGHIVNCNEFIYGIYTHIAVSCAHKLNCLCDILRGIFVAGPYMAVTSITDIAVGCFGTHTQKYWVCMTI